MLPIEPLGLSANQWQFLARPERYVKASSASGGTLVLEPTRRQFLTARDILTRMNGSNRKKPKRGLLLADDVGLGKTTVAALVAWVVASAGEKRGVRIFAPNDVMVDRWASELKSHVLPLTECAPALDVREKRVKVGKVSKLSAGSIQVVKHSYAASDFRLTCDLLIVDEAHRAKGDMTEFSAALKRQKKNASRILILTATPFSIQLKELKRMLTLIGGEDANHAVRAYSHALDNLYHGNTARSAEKVAERLMNRAKEAVEALRPYVIRHGIDDLPQEQAFFGVREELVIPVSPAQTEEVELMLRMDRALRVARDQIPNSANATNDPRFHVGWRHLDHVSAQLNDEASSLADPAKTVVMAQLSAVAHLRGKADVHPKMKAVASAVRDIVDTGEKALLFCHHHATAQELTAHLHTALPRKVADGVPNQAIWRKAWNDLLTPRGDERDETLRETFIEWLCSDLIRMQTWGWLDTRATSASWLADALKGTSGRHASVSETLVEAAERLLHTLLGSRSSRAVLREAKSNRRLELLPGGHGTSRVMGVCTPSENEDESPLFVHNQRPDTVIAIFNSPFGPDVLVVTDRLSEGIDLHRYCRHLIHYELDPSPIRTIQRNGRVRRVNSWAAVTRQPIFYSYPAFPNTRDYRLVQIMKKRIESFSLLLGGVQGFDVDAIRSAEESWRNSVIKHAKDGLIRAGMHLRCPL